MKKKLNIASDNLNNNVFEVTLDTDRDKIIDILEAKLDELKNPNDDDERIPCKAFVLFGYDSGENTTGYDFEFTHHGYDVPEIIHAMKKVEAYILLRELEILE